MRTRHPLYNYTCNFVYQLKKSVRHIIESCIFSIHILNLSRDYLNQFVPIKLFPSQKEMEKKGVDGVRNSPNQCLTGKRSENQ